MKFFGTIATVLAGAAVAKCVPASYPTTIIGGQEVIDTPLVREAHALVKGLFPLYLYKHVVRCWLYGAAQFNNNATLKSEVDLEVHAVATLMHDMGWDMTPNSEWVTLDNRFEIDGALGAKKFVTNSKYGKGFDAWRLEQLQDGIRLHGNFYLEVGKSQTVQSIVTSIHLDNPGTTYPGIPNAQVNKIVADFPLNDLAAGANETLTWLCEIKPLYTYDSIEEPFGTAYVPGYSPVGYRAFDFITNAILENKTWTPLPT
ncbi:hypothetical protein F5Y16DRAFT_367494 [Xylariaceae sp. FL0255]|nr:hypothetical protein F5Y16DRAFT_367494 [Xylariaceae sp. FL0255]